MMTGPIVSLQEYLCNLGMDVDACFLPEGISLLTRLVMDMEVSEQIGEEWHERAEGRETHRNGYRERLWETRVGEVPLERLNKEVRRLTNVVGIFPDVASVLRLMGPILIEVHDEWQVGWRCFSKSSMWKLKHPQELGTLLLPMPLRLAPIRQGITSPGYRSQLHRLIG